MAKYKILLYNIGYARTSNKSMIDYALHLYRFMFCSKKKVNNILDGINQLVRKEDPNLFCIIEAEPKYIPLFSKYMPYYSMNVKYGPESLLHNLPFFRQKSNGFFSKDNLRFKKHYLSSGAKRLVYEVALPDDTSLFMVHLSLMKKTRRKQFAELKDLVNHKKKLIVCGDFNIYRGTKELELFLYQTNLRLANPCTKTFPSFKPKRNLDLFLCSKNIDVKQCFSLDEHYSDHLPVILEM